MEQQSPSHAVGFELYIANAFSLGMLSSSHTVGLERDGDGGTMRLLGEIASIPHGGLGTSMRMGSWFSNHRFSRHPTQWAQNCVIFCIGSGSISKKVSIPHGGLGSHFCINSCILRVSVTIPRGGLETKNLACRYQAS